MIIRPARASLRRWPWPEAIIALALSLGPLIAGAVTPSPDGGYPEANTAEGGDALKGLTTGSGNTAIGFDALYTITTGGSNTATGCEALRFNTGSGNTATGYQALELNNSGGYNTAVGLHALFSSLTGNGNTADGYNALYSNRGGNYNVAAGYYSLLSNTDGNYNVAQGYVALQNNETGNYNTANGAAALANSNGNYNTAGGYNALVALTTGSNNVALGSNAGQKVTSGSNNIIIGANVLASASDANVTRIGNTSQKKTFIGGISGKTVANGVGVIINSNGQLGTIQSSVRYKTAIKPMDKASEGLLALKPVTFRYKEELDPEKIPQFGLIAEEVEKVNPDLVVRDEEGRVSTVRYEAVNAMLLNEFLKEHRKVEEQERMIAEQRSEFESRLAQQEREISALAALVQQVKSEGVTIEHKR
jgi:hypothetical protein